jgi:hypothetical protein
MVNEFPADRLQLLVTHLKLEVNRNFTNVNLQNFRICAEIMEYENISIKNNRGRFTYLEKLQNVFKAAKRFLNRRGQEVTGRTIAEAIEDIYIDPLGYRRRVARQQIEIAALRDEGKQLFSLKKYELQILFSFSSQSS